MDVWTEPTISAGPIDSQKMELLRRHFDAEARGDVDAVLADVTDDCRYQTVRDGVPLREDYRQAIEGVRDRISRGLSERTISVRRAFANESAGCAEIVLSGRHTGVLNGLEPTDEYVNVHRGVIFTFDEGKISSKHVYGDRSRLVVGQPGDPVSDPDGQPTADPTGAVVGATETGENVDLMLRHMRNEEAGDSPAVLNEMAEDGYYQLWARGGDVIRDRATITAIHQELISGLGDLKLELRHVVATGKLGCVELVVSGRHRHLFHGFEATGKELQHHVLSIFSFVGGMIESETIYSDRRQIERQLNGG